MAANMAAATDGSNSVRTAWRLCIKLSDQRFMLGQTHARLLCPEKSLSFVSRIQFPRERARGSFQAKKIPLQHPFI